MAEMTKEEASALDDLFTKNPPAANPNVKGVFARERDMLAGLYMRMAKYQDDRIVIS